MLAHVEPRHAQAKERDLLAQPMQFALGQQARRGGDSGFR